MHRSTWCGVMLFLVAGLLSHSWVFGQQSKSNLAEESPSNAAPSSQEKAMESITLGGGCFWCVEAVFQRMDGVKSIVSGYSGGQKPNPTYKEVCTGLTGHAEVVQIEFDPEVVSLEQIFVVFLKTHDPTTLNRQGPDFGTQYRSVIFYASEEQRKAAERVIQKMESEKVYRSPIVTEVTKLGAFYKAEDYHQNYYNQHKGESYCQRVVREKVLKFEKLFKEYSVANKKRQSKKKDSEKNTTKKSESDGDSR